MEIVVTGRHTEVPEKFRLHAVDKLAKLDLFPTIEGWNKESAASLRQLTLGVRLPRADGELRLVAALEAEPGIARMELEPAT